MIKKIVLAYSGGLDTSVILKWLQNKYNAEIITYTSNLGQKINRKEIIKNAKTLGVKEIIIEKLELFEMCENPLKNYTQSSGSYTTYDSNGITGI